MSPAEGGDVPVAAASCPTAALAFPAPQPPLRRGRAGKVEARVLSVTFPLKWLFGKACVRDVVLVGLFAGFIGWFGCF